MSAPREALALFGMEGAAIGPRVMRENQVYRVTHDGADYALRLHRPGYRSRAQLESELQWMAMLAEHGLGVPSPRAALNGKLVAELDGRHVSLLTWLPGAPLGQTGAPLALECPRAVFTEIGEEMASLHEISDLWTPPPDFDRPDWDLDGLIGEAPVWGRFWEAPFLTPGQRDLLCRLRDAAAADLAGAALDYGLIHADLVRENVLLGDRALFIDFDDGGWGFRLFDIATALVKNSRDPAYPEIRAGLIEGYGRLRGIDLTRLPLFMALRAATYVGWIADRMDEDDAEARAQRHLDYALPLTEAYLAQRHA